MAIPTYIIRHPTFAVLPLQVIAVDDYTSSGVAYRSIAWKSLKPPMAPEGKKASWQVDDASKSILFRLDSNGTDYMAVAVTSPIIEFGYNTLTVKASPWAMDKSFNKTSVDDLDYFIGYDPVVFQTTEGKSSIYNYVTQTITGKGGIVATKQAAITGKSKIQINKFTGDIILTEGYQFGIGVAGQTLILTASKDSGEPLDCTQFFVGVNDCATLISSINGIETLNNPGIFQIHAGNNINILEDPIRNRLYIGLKFDKNDVCFPVSSITQL